MTATGEIAAMLWRDHDERVNALRGMYLGAHQVALEPVDAADWLYELGARRVDLPEPVDLSDDTQPALTMRVLALIKELTARGVAVGWRLRAGERTDWRTLSHLWPPHSVLGGAASAGRGAEDADDVAIPWRSTYYVGKCVYRHGPGFVQVRDRRGGELVKLTIDDPVYITAIAALVEGAPAGGVPSGVLADFAAENLITQVGTLALWLPYRVHRWPVPSLVV